jgi:CRISPR-associated protein Cas1
MPFDEIGPISTGAGEFQERPAFGAGNLIDEDDTEWPERCEHWIAQAAKSIRPRRRRERRKEPLVLCGHGVSFRVDNGALVVKNGFTHFPQAQETLRFFRGDLGLPARIVIVNGDGVLTLDAIAWLAQQGVVLVTLDWRGEVVSMIGSASYAADPAKVRWQIETRNDPARRLAFSVDLIRKKIAASIEALAVLPASPARATALGKLTVELDGLARNPPSDIDALRGTEGRASAAYFLAWRGLSLRFSNSARRPVPDDWRHVGTRTSNRPGKKPKNENATHPLNAMLNYAYAILQARVQIEAVSAGYDATIGIMHHGYRDNAAYAFDLMEPERPKIDAAVLTMAAEHTFCGADFAIQPDGSCRLAPQLARRIGQILT